MPGRTAYRRHLGRGAAVQKDGLADIRVDVHTAQQDIAPGQAQACLRGTVLWETFGHHEGHRRIGVGRTAEVSVADDAHPGRTPALQLTAAGPAAT